MNVSEMEFLTVPEIMLAHVQTEAEKELCSFYIIEIISFIIFNRKLWVGKGNT